MIKDSVALQNRLAEWAAVKKLCADAYRGDFLPNGGIYCYQPPDHFFNLPFFLAFSVLEQVLSDLIAQGTIACIESRPPLGRKMELSKSALPWQDYLAVDAARVARNEIAHDAVLHKDSDCRVWINAIERELLAWGILEHPMN